MTDKSKKETTIKRWIELPKSVAEAIAVVAQRENRSDKAQTEVLIVERLREIEEQSKAKVAA